MTPNSPRTSAHSSPLGAPSLRCCAARLSLWGWVGLCSVLALFSGPVLAWNESGHRVIAAAAARAMTPELRAQVVTVLRAHPRYAEDIAAFRPKRLRGLSEAEWLMGQAAQWPDHARRFDNAPRHKREALVLRYHHGNWHYINLPVYHARTDKSLRIKDPMKRINPAEPRDVLAALTFMRAALADPSTSMEDKGLWVSWALHLIADVHQPLHTSALFSKDRWPNGDRGGNEVKISGSGKRGRLDSLHYFWDSAISNRRRPSEVSELAERLAKQKLKAANKDELRPDRWIREGRGIASSKVYDPLRAQLLQSPVVEINERYTRRAHSVALKRGALAARRTAAWLADALGG